MPRTKGAVDPDLEFLDAVIALALDIEQGRDEIFETSDNPDVLEIADMQAVRAISIRRRVIEYRARVKELKRRAAKRKRPAGAGGP